jgi:hypothetical protein
VKSFRREDGFTSTIRERGYAQKVMDKVFIAEDISDHCHVLDAKNALANSS